MGILADGKLKIVAKLGELMPAKQGKGGGRGKKKLPAPDTGSLFSSHTVTRYRKVARNRPQIDDPTRSPRYKHGLRPA